MLARLLTSAPASRRRHAPTASTQSKV